MASGDRPVNVFISYAHEDRRWCIRLRDQLGALVNLGHIHLFDDGEIGAGEKWDGRIRQELDSADIIVLIVSDKFMASKYSATIELRHAVERHASRTVCVIPVIADHVDVEALPFHDLQFFPLDDNRDLKPLVDWKEEVSRPLADIARRIRKEAERIKGTTTTVPERPAPVRPPRLPETALALRARGMIGAGLLLVVAMLLLWKSQTTDPPAQSPSMASPAPTAPASAPAQNPIAQNSRGPATEPDRTSLRTGAGTLGRTNKRDVPIPNSHSDPKQPSAGSDQVAGNSSGQPAANETPTAPPAAPPPDPEEVRRQLFARASALVECVLRNQDEASARRILRLLRTAPTSDTTRGIMADLKNAWPGGTQNDHRTIVSEINCLPKRP